jgi:NAD(P)-dependent dehydrogenase (short-subunit alcohol dehydrogenase family)
VAHLRATASRYPAFVDGRRVAIVTGGATGIGRTISEGLAADGLAVVVGYFGNEVGAEETARAIEAGGGEVRLVRGDAGDPAAGDALVEAAMTSFGRLDVLCGHAGLTLFRGFLEMEPQAFDRLVATNLRGTYFTAQAAARRMVEQGQGGRIVLTSSVTGQRAIAGASAYAMTKAGIEALARNLAIELADAGITVNGVIPGSIVNERNLADDPAYAARWAAVNPVGRVGRGLDVLAAIRFLIGPDAGFITGQSIVVDGGWTIAGRTPDDVVRLGGAIEAATDPTGRPT